ncbi:DUF6541 family protein [Herbiconiux sp. L3-i23]|uniref:DUF6541 family protein n=1 Tax=Herbiconiux sp. L3-i23 TaxID=2905871 RepID=UPI0020492B03|nr:DUF6541 family protein [Herbiconiux sp. L3-i23]BDI21612.1 hypothetical protein L3i23_03880 [Herbiconiux sp. L3-i23]
MSEWISVVPAVLVAVLILVIPGGVAAFLARVRGLALLALSAPVSLAIIGAAAVVTGAIGVPFGIPTVAVATVVVAALAWAAGRWLPASPALREGFARGPLLLVSGAALVATIATAAIAFGSVASPDLVSQTYDGVFHLNAVASVLQTGDASSFHLYRMTHPGDGIEFYPAAWHAIVALVVQMTGSSIGLATSAVWIAVTGAVFALGSAWFAAVVVPVQRVRVVVPVVGALAGSLTAAGPYLLLQWGVLYPTGLAYALLPAGLALAVLVLRRVASREVVLPVLLVAVWLAASVFAHPRSLISFALLVLPLLVAALASWARGELRDAARRRRTIVILAGVVVATAAAAAIGSMAVLRYFAADVRPISDRLNGGPATARQSLGESLLQGLLLAPPSGPDESTLPVTGVLAASILVALVLAFRVKGLRWAAVAYLLTVVLYALAAGSNSDFAKLATGFWYKDKFRLFALLGVLAPPLLAAAAATLTASLARVRRWGRRGGLIAASVVLVVVTVASWFGPTLGGMRDAVARNYELAAQKDGRLLDTDEVALFGRLAELTPPGSVIVGDPWNGSTLTWAIGGRESLFPHLTGEWDEDRDFVRLWVDRVSLDPAICAALDRLDAHYLFASDGLLWNGDPQAEEFAAISRAADAPGFTLVAEEGGSRLFRISACD